MRQAPPPLGVDAMATTGAFKGRARIDAEGIARGPRRVLASSTSPVADLGESVRVSAGVRADAEPTVAAITHSVASRIAGRATRRAAPRLLRTMSVPPTGVPVGHPSQRDRHAARSG